MLIKCPNHSEPLHSIEMEPLPSRQGSGICPVSGCEFEFEYDPDPKKMYIDKKTGQPMPHITVKDDGQESE